MYQYYKKMSLVAAFCCLFISSIYSIGGSNANGTLLNIATSDILQGGSGSNINIPAPFLNLLSSATNSSNSSSGGGNSAVASAVSAATNPSGPTYVKARLDGLLFNGNDVDIIATTDPTSSINLTLHTPATGTVRITLDSNLYAQPITGLKIVQDQSAATFAAQGDVSLDYVFNIAGNANVTFANALTVLSGTGGAFIYIESGSSLTASSILFDGRNQSAIRNYGSIQATAGDIVMQNTLGVIIWAGVENRGQIAATAGSVFVNNNQGGDTSAAIYNSNSITAQQNLSISSNTAGANNQAIYNIGIMSAQQDVNIMNNQCGANSYALYNDNGGQILSGSRNVIISNNNDVINYGVINAASQLTFQDNVAVTTNGVFLQDSGVVQSDTIRFINNAGVVSANGVVMTGTIYASDQIVITTDCTSANQNVSIQVPFYVSGSNKQTLFPSSNVIINNTGSCSISSVLSVLGDIVVDGNANTIAITVPGSTITNYISAVGPVQIIVPPTGDLTINGISYAGGIPGLTLTKMTSIVQFFLGGYLAQNGSILLQNNAGFLMTSGLTITAMASGNFVTVNRLCSLISLASMIFDGSHIGSFVNNGTIGTFATFGGVGGNIVIKNSNNTSGAAVTINGQLQTPVNYGVSFNNNISTSAQGVLFGGAGIIQVGSTLFLNNIGANNSYGSEIDGALQTDLLNITVDCSSNNQDFLIGTTPTVYNGGTILTNVIISNNECLIGGGTLQASDGTITFDGSNIDISGTTISVVGDYGVILEIPSSGSVTINGAPYNPGDIANLYVQQNNSSNTFSVEGSLRLQNMIMLNSAQVTTSGSVTVTNGTFNLQSGSLTVGMGLSYDGGNNVGTQFMNFGPIVATSGDISIVGAKVNSSTFPGSIAVYVGNPITANAGDISISNNSNLDTYNQNTVVFIFDHVTSILGNISVNGNSAAGGCAVQLGYLSQCQLEANGVVVMDNNIGGAADYGKAILTQPASRITAGRVEMNNNQAGTGSNTQAIYHQGTIITSETIVMNNNAVGNQGYALFLLGGSINAGTSLTISNNYCVSNAAAIGVYSAAQIQAGGNIIMNNNSCGAGGYGIFANAFTMQTPASLTISSNSGGVKGAQFNNATWKIGTLGTQSVFITVDCASRQDFETGSFFKDYTGGTDLTIGTEIIINQTNGTCVTMRNS